MPKVFVSLSGGMDSATLLGLAISQHPKEDVSCVGFIYPSKHNPFELEAAIRVASHYGVRLRTIDVSDALAGAKSALLASDGRPIPEGHYETESMRQTVVPGRNLIFLSVLASAAESNVRDGEVGEVWIGCHQGDHAIYPDCRVNFVHTAARAVHFSSDGKVRLMAPFLYEDKSRILGRGIELNVPYHLTRTCYTADPVACGRCGACQERLMSFAECGIQDPLEYQSREIMPR